MIFEENLQYKHDIDSSKNLPKEWKIILNWVSNNKMVLEIGCHTGDLSRLLKESGCSVTGIEINSKALEKAKPFLTEAVSGDIESAQTWNSIEGKKFDVILFEHVLEHLTNPWQILNNSKNYLAKDGMVIIALPNISNAHSRFDMFFGKFAYEDIGVMDKTHLRFFNQKTARELIAQAGMKVDDYESYMCVNPVREFIDHLPVLTHLRFMFRKNISRSSLFSPNLTDVVMLLKCSPINDQS
jgi:2-polyprenyl-3-methyl-5-hydroxy-6-metoxy-1,4-benzoquinol methylase